jgi:hypothetical protein
MEIYPELPERYPWLNLELPDGNSLHDHLEIFDWEECFEGHAEEGQRTLEMIKHSFGRITRFSPEAAQLQAQLIDTVEDIDDWVVAAWCTLARSGWHDLRWAVIKATSQAFRSMGPSWQPGTAEEVVLRVIEQALTLWKTTPPEIIQAEVGRWSTPVSSTPENATEH